MQESREEGERNSLTTRPEPILLSMSATFPVYAVFINSTDRFVDVVWIDYNGQWIRYETLAPAGRFDIYTFVSHPWVFVDAHTGTRMLALNRGRVFTAEMGDIRLQADPDGQTHLVPAVVTIIIPMFSLKERCMEEICARVRDRDALDLLSLPREVIQDVVRTYDGHHSYTIINVTDLTTTDDEADDEDDRLGDNEDEGTETEGEQAEIRAAQEEALARLVVHGTTIGVLESMMSEAVAQIAHVFTQVNSTVTELWTGGTAGSSSSRSQQTSTTSTVLDNPALWVEQGRPTATNHPHLVRRLMLPPTESTTTTSADESDGM